MNLFFCLVVLYPWLMLWWWWILIKFSRDECQEEVDTLNMSLEREGITGNMFDTGEMEEQ